MRITAKMIQGRVLRNLQQSKERLMASQERIATQKNIGKPSDDPIGLVRIMGYRRDLHKLDQTLRNAGNASTTLNQMDSALQNVSDLILDVRVKAGSMSSDTMNAEDRQAMADEIQYVIDDVLQEANTKLGSRYLFSGHRILTQPYQKVDGQVRYMGNNGTIEQRIELNGSMITNVPGSTVFGGSVFPITTTVADATISDAGPPAIGLDNGTIESELRNAFAAEVAPLSGGATVTTDEAGERWQITDGGETYYVENYSAGADDNRLRIFADAPFGLTAQDVTISDAGPPLVGMDNGTITDELRDAFLANDITLSGDATVSVDVAGERWQITDGNDMYYVENYDAGADDNRLRIYESDDGGIFRVLEDLRDALDRDDVSEIAESQDLMDAEIDRIAGVRGGLGMKINRVEASINELNILNISLNSELSQIEEVDMAMEAGKYLANQEAYQMTLEATASALQLPSLIDFLK